MEDRQLKAIDARINYIARVFELEPFIVVPRPKRLKSRKIMTRFLQGIGVTLLAICIGFRGYYTYQDIKSDIAFDKTHYSASMTCWNCSTSVYFHVEKGTKAAGTEHTCKRCGMMVMIPEG